ncbi:MAG: hypothetical protein HRU09_12505 [Oligoflexales bacterium]|nr:hypothetical protein [Oligoflexales bacterium]
MIIKTANYRQAKPDVIPQHLRSVKRPEEPGLDFSPFFVGIDKRRISSGKAAAFVNRQEARMVNKMLTDMASSVAEVESHLSKIAHFQQVGEKPALFHHSRKEYQNDLVYLKRMIKRAFEDGFSEYINYQDY